MLCSEIWKVGFQLMQILSLLDVYYDAAVVFVTKQLFTFIQIGSGHTVIKIKVSQNWP